MSRRVKTPKPQKSEGQWTNGRWAVARQRPMQHAYLVLHGGQHVGWVAPVSQGMEVGWRWITTWNPRTGGAQERTSRHAFRSWEFAVAALAATAVAKAVTKTSDIPVPDDWRQHSMLRGKVWTPTPERVEVAQ